MYDYIDNQIDLSILRYLKQQEKEFSKEDINRREEFYRKLNRRSEIDQKLNGLLQPWLRLYEESIYLMWLLSKLYERIDTPKSPVTLVLDLIKNVNSVRILFLSGYSSMGLALYRRAFEEMQLELLIILDKNEAQAIMGESLDANEYWNKHVGRGKAAKKIETVLKDVDETCYNEFIKDPIGSKLSEFIHANSSSALPIEPYIGDPNFLSLSPFGTYNYNSIQSLKSLVNKQIAFVAANISLILKDKVWFDLGGTEDVAHEVSSILMSYNALSACFDNYKKMHESEPDMYDYIDEVDS